jgi:hypothetical protein
MEDLTHLKKIGLTSTSWIFSREDRPRIFEGYHIKNFYARIENTGVKGVFSRGIFYLNDKELYRAWGIRKNLHCSYHAYKNGDSFTRIYEGCPSVLLSDISGSEASLTIDEADYSQKYKVVLIPQVFVFSISGLTCERCEEKVRSLLMSDKNIESITFGQSRSIMTLCAYKKPVLGMLQSALQGTKYKVSENKFSILKFIQNIKKFLPLILVFSLVLIFTLLHMFVYGTDIHVFMQYFMAGYFLIFGGLKVINWKKFVTSYRAYDALAAKSAVYAYFYPALEVGLGVIYYLGLASLLVHICVGMLMTQKAYSVYRKLESGDKVICACLGGFFSIPITRVTLVEDAFMSLMALYMAFTLIM